MSKMESNGTLEVTVNPSPMTPTFKDQSWEQRFKKLGDEAETAFETVNAHRMWERSGWNRPRFSIGKMPRHLCYMPDYVMDSLVRVSVPAWYEVQGCGRDQFFKFKIDKLQSLKWWQATAGMPVYLWLWDGTNKRHFVVTIDTLWNMVVKPYLFGGEKGTFPEGKEFIKFPVETFVQHGYEG